MTGRIFVSQIRSLSKLLSSDQRITDRAILNEGRNAVNMIVKQTLDKRKLLNSPNLFTNVQCLEMEQAPLSECCDISSNKMVAKSVKTLPQIGEGYYGLSISGVFGLDGKVKFKETNPNRYSNIIRLNTGVKDVYYWIQNDHLYVTNPDTKLVNAYIFFTEAVPNDILYPGEDCDCKPKPSLENLCKNPLDNPFNLPMDRLSDINNMVYTTVLKVYLQMATDKTDNDLDETSK